MALNIQLVVACSNLKIRKYSSLSGVHSLEGHVEVFTFLNSPKAEAKAKELYAQRKNVWWMYCPTDHQSGSAPVFLAWKEFLNAERIIEYNKPAIQDVVANMELTGSVVFDAEEWHSITGRDKYQNETFASQNNWLKDTELDMWRYRTQTVYYMKLAGTDKYQFIKPEELKALGYDFDALYQPQQA